MSGPHPSACLVWKLISVEIEDVNAPVQSVTFGTDLLPYDVNESRQSSARAQNLGSERDDFGTVVTEVTVVTTRKKYRMDT